MALVVIYNVLDSKYITKGFCVKNGSWGVMRVLEEGDRLQSIHFHLSAPWFLISSCGSSIECFDSYEANLRIIM